MAFAIDQPGGHPYAVTCFEDAAFHLVTHGQAARDFCRIGRLAFVAQDGIPRHHGEAGELPQRVDHVLGQSVDKILVRGVVTLIQEGENGDCRFRADFGGLRPLHVRTGAIERELRKQQRTDQQSNGNHDQG